MIANTLIEKQLIANNEYPIDTAYNEQANVRDSDTIVAKEKCFMADFNTLFVFLTLTTARLSIKSCIKAPLEF